MTYQSSRIFYRTIGKGRPVVLIHGFGEDGNIWDKQVEFLSAGSGGKDKFQLIIPDLPGSGSSEMIEHMSIEGMAESIKAVIDFELRKSPLQGAEGAKLSLIGHSMGGYISLAFAEKYPQLLLSFGLVHSSAFADSEEKKAMRLKAIAFIKKNGAYEFLKTSIPGLFAESWTKDHRQEIDDLVEKSKDFSDAAIIQYYRSMIERPDRTAILKSFSGPVLLIIGEHDNAVPFAQSMQQSYLPDNPYIHILRRSAHMAMWEETGKVNTALSGFLSWQPM
ncbi:MAG TPA: alpha/beta fold hydrolase [Ferruginibacter sp.]|nr:alpha/beta fold hydrolase [Ferruginibacter sp.]